MNRLNLDWIKLYSEHQNNKTIKFLAEKYNCSVSCIRRNFKTQNFKTKYYGTYSLKLDWNTLFKEYETGKTLKLLSIKYNCNQSTIGKNFRKLGYKLRSKGTGAPAGKNHYRWKGGSTKLTQQIRNSRKYVHWRDSIFIRDNYTCQKCLKRGGRLEAHHKKEFAEILHSENIKNIEQAKNSKILFDIENGVTLCKVCHENKHLLYGKK